MDVFAPGPDGQRSANEAPFRDAIVLPQSGHSMPVAPTGTLRSMTTLPTNPAPPRRRAYRWLSSCGKSRSFWILLGLLAVSSPFVLYGGAIFWQVRQVEQLCGELRPGTPFGAIQPAIKKHGLWNGLSAYQFEHDGNMGTYREKAKLWDLGVPATLTYGDTECAIWHDGKVVVRTQVLN